MTSPMLGRRSALTAALAAVVGLPSRPAGAAVDRLARIVVGSPPGSGTDIVARLIAEQLVARSYAPNVIVENRPGASSRLAAEAVKAAAPDGTTMLQAPMPVLTLAPHVFPRTTRFDPLVDFVPATTIGELAYGLVVRANHPARNLEEFLNQARQRGGATFAPPVLGTPQHMLGLGLASRAGVAFTVVPYRGGAFAQQDLLGGRLDCFMSHMAELAANLGGGQTRLLAVSAPARLPSQPDAPTFAEAGFPELTASEAFCLMLPARAPAALADALHRAVEAAVTEPMLRERFTRLNLSPLVLSPQAISLRVRDEFAAWGPIVRASGFTAEE